MDDVCTKLLERLRIYSLEFPPSADTYKAWSCMFYLADGFLERQVAKLVSATYRTLDCAFVERGMIQHNRSYGVEKYWHLLKLKLNLLWGGEERGILEYIIRTVQ